MNTVTVIVWLVMIGAGIWLTVRMRQSRKSKGPKNDTASRQGRAVWAWAKVVSSTNEPASMGWMRVVMELEVHAPGSEPCPAKVTWLVDRESLEYVEAGKEISLKADPQDPRYVFPNGSWAKSTES